LISGRDKIFLSYLKLPGRLRAHLEHYSNGEAFDLEIKRTSCEANHPSLSSAEVCRLVPYAFIAYIRIILLSAGKKIVPNGQERKTLKYAKTAARIKKRDLRGSKWYWTGRNHVIRNFVTIYLVLIKHS
jgi:hypothetical protein